MNEYDRDFKGVWIPKELYLNDSLSWTEKILLVEIDSLDIGEGCYASNEYLGQFLGVTGGQAANIISGLRKRGLIEDVKFDGRKRWIRVHENMKLGLSKNSNPPSGKAEDTNIVEKYSRDTTPPISPPKSVIVPWRKEGMRPEHDFEETFWKIYPKKKAKKDALKAWISLVKSGDITPRTMDEIHADIMVRLKFDSDWKRDDGQFIPYPATYLRGLRWKDEGGKMNPEYCTQCGTILLGLDGEEKEAMKHRLCVLCFFDPDREVSNEY